MDKLAKMQEIQ